MKNIDWNSVEESEFTKIVPGGYIAFITSVEDNEQKEYLRMGWDFCDPKLKGTNRDTYDRMGFWPTSIFRSYKESALSFFKSFKTAVEKSNPGYLFRNDPQSLQGHLIGVVLGEEEYINGKGQKKTRLYVAGTRSVEAIQKGDFVVPDLKKLPESPAAAPAAPAYAVMDDDDSQLPF